MNTAKMSHPDRRFEGPFLVLGMLPSWPQELERRRDFEGAHTQLSALKVLAAAVPGLVPPKASPGPSNHVLWTGGGAFAQKHLKNKLSPWFLGKLEHAVELLAKPKTVKQLARALDCSTPIVYALLELLRRRGFPLAIGTKGRSRTFTLSPEGKA